MTEEIKLTERDKLIRALNGAINLIDAMTPGVPHIALQDYAALNEVPIELKKALASVESPVAELTDMKLAAAIRRARDRMDDAELKLEVSRISGNALIELCRRVDAELEMERRASTDDGYSGEELLGIISDLEDRRRCARSVFEGLVLKNYQGPGVGDVLTQRNGRKYMVKSVSVSYSPISGKPRVRLWGQHVKKDGSMGTGEKELRKWDFPDRLDE